MDITIGQYFPKNSLIHRLDPRTKLLAVIFYMVMIFVSKNAYSFLVSGLLMVTVIALSKIHFPILNWFKVVCVYGASFKLPYYWNIGTYLYNIARYSDGRYGGTFKTFFQNWCAFSRNCNDDDNCFEIYSHLCRGCG